VATKELLACRPVRAVVTGDANLGGECEVLGATIVTWLEPAHVAGGVLKKKGLDLMLGDFLEAMLPDEVSVDLGCRRP
jgi:hypothetical protein